MKVNFLTCNTFTHVNNLFQYMLADKLRIFNKYQCNIDNKIYGTFKIILLLFKYMHLFCIARSGEF